jgi:hypothetical protein
LAAEACYSPEEAEADAALRYHAHLRVIGLSCTSPQSGQSLFPYYQTFTTNNGDLLKSYQDRLTAYYQAHAAGDPAKKLHTRETEVENDESLVAAKAGHTAFCRDHMAELQKVVLESATQVKRDIAAYGATNPPPRKLCVTAAAPGHP